MRLVAISVVKNEADVIEAFVRHTAAWVDVHLVFDHQSTDGTHEILIALQREGIPITLFTDDAIGNFQQQRSNHLARLAALEHDADWILPLDADEFLSGPSRPALERTLALTSAAPASLPLLDYCLSDADDATEPNPALRQRHAQRSFSPTRKLMLPRAIALDVALTIDKGSHTVSSPAGTLPDVALPAEFWLAHLSQRSVPQQAVRLATAELQKLSQGRRHASVDVHYRLGFQLLAENPALFATIVRRPHGILQHRPIGYRGGPLRYTGQESGERAVRALLPFFESLAQSHGALIDRADNIGAATDSETSPMRPLTSAGFRPRSRAGTADAFAGFTPLEGWGPPEGPIAAAFLPAFHWAMAPTTRLEIPGRSDGALLRCEAEVLTYCEGQTLEARLDGEVFCRFTFPRIYQKESLAFTFPPAPHARQLTVTYRTHLPASVRDPRALAVIFLSLHIAPVDCL